MSGASLEVEPALKPKLGIVDRFTKWSLNWVPDSMVFVSALTIIVFIMGMVFTDHSPLGLLDDYAKGFWLLLTFAMQLTVMMITGFVVADSKLVKSGLIKLIDLPKSPRSTLIVFCLVVGFIAWLHWAVGLMVAVVMSGPLRSKRA